MRGRAGQIMGGGFSGGRDQLELEQQRQLRKQVVLI